MGRNYRFSLRMKLVLLTTLLAVVTYTTSAVFLYFLYDYVQAYWDVSKQLFTVITLGLGIFWSAVLAYFAARFITKPLEKLVNFATNAAGGNVNQTVEIPASDDEIRALSTAVDIMLKNLTNMVHNIDKHFNTTNQTVVQMKQASDQATEQSRLISTSIDEISQGAETSAASVQQTVEEVEVATELAEHVQQKANHSNEKAELMLQTLTKSKEMVNQFVTGIQNLAAEQEKSLHDVDSLKQNTMQIESIIGMVGDIADQTNLLALNASIEAARAGEHGRGFAVVADEIRKLADQSAKAVADISRLLTANRDNVQVVVAKINDNVDYTKKEAENGTEIKVAIEQMSGSVNDVAAAIKEISEMVQKQLTAIQETVKQSQEVAAVAEETSAGAEEVNAAIQEQTSVMEQLEELASVLEEQANGLNNQIQQFNVDEIAADGHDFQNNVFKKRIKTF